MYASNLAKNMATMNLSEVETSIVKATYEDDAPPKEKHVLNLISLTKFEQDLSFSTLLFKRFAEKKWRINLKTLILIHRLCRDGHEKVVERFEARKAQIQPLFTYLDRSTPAQSKLVSLYSQYIYEKLSVFGLVGYSAERVQPTQSKEWALGLSLPEVIVALPATQQQFAALLKIDPFYASRETSYIHPLAVIIFTMLLRDALRLYSVSTVQILVALEHYDDMTRDDLVILLESCYRSRETNAKFRNWCQLLSRCRIAKNVVPDFAPLPDHFFLLVENRIDELDGKPPRHGVVKDGQTTTSNITKKTPKPPSMPPPMNVKKTSDIKNLTTTSSQQSQRPPTQPVFQDKIAPRQVGALTKLKAEKRARNSDANYDQPGEILLPDPALAANSQRLLTSTASTTPLAPTTTGRRGHRQTNTFTTPQKSIPIESKDSDTESEDLELFALEEDFDQLAIEEHKNAQNQGIDMFSVMATQVSGPAPTQQYSISQNQLNHLAYQTNQADQFNFDAFDALLKTDETAHNDHIWASIHTVPNGISSTEIKPNNTKPTQSTKAVNEDPFAALAAEVEKDVIGPTSHSTELVLHDSENNGRSANANYLYPVPLNTGPPVHAGADSGNTTLEFDPFAGLVRPAFPQAYYPQQPYSQPIYPQSVYHQQPQAPVYGQSAQPLYQQPPYQQYSAPH